MNKKYIIPAALIAGAASMIGLQAFAQSTTTTTPQSAPLTQTVSQDQTSSNAKDKDLETNDDTASTKDSDTDQEINDDDGDAPDQIHSGDKAEVDNHSNGEANDE